MENVMSDFKLQYDQAVLRHGLNLGLVKCRKHLQNSQKYYLYEHINVAKIIIKKKNLCYVLT